MAVSEYQLTGIILVSIILVLIVGFAVERKISRLRIQVEQERLSSQKIAEDLAERLFNQWAEKSVNAIRSEITEIVKKDYQVQLESWKKQEEKKIREDAIQKSINTLLGKIGEEFSPVLLSNRYGVNLKDFRHLGTPVDFVAFKGLSDEAGDMEVIFLEIKSGESSSLVKRERRVRDAVVNKRVRYEVVNLNDSIGAIKNGLNSTGMQK